MNKNIFSAFSDDLAVTVYTGISREEQILAKRRSNINIWQMIEEVAGDSANCALVTGFITICRQNDLSSTAKLLSVVHGRTNLEHSLDCRRSNNYI